MSPPTIASLARDLAERARREGYDELTYQIIVLVANLADVTVTTVVPIAESRDGGAEPPGVLTIRRVVESCEALALDDEDDRELLVSRLAAALGIA